MAAVQHVPQRGSTIAVLNPVGVPFRFCYGSPGCAARPWALEFNRVAVGTPRNIDRAILDFVPTMTIRSTAALTKAERQRRSTSKPRVAQRTLGGGGRSTRTPTGFYNRGVEPRWGTVSVLLRIPRVRCATLGSGVQPRCGWNTSQHRPGNSRLRASNDDPQHGGADKGRTPTAFYFKAQGRAAHPGWWRPFNTYPNGVLQSRC